jgi:hypothetical protein
MLRTMAAAAFGRGDAAAEQPYPADEDARLQASFGRMLHGESPLN